MRNFKVNVSECNDSVLLSFSPHFYVKLEFIGSKTQSALGAVVYPSALGNTLVCLQQLELQRGRGEKCCTHLFLFREYGGKGESKRDRERRSDVVKAWKMDPYVWRTM